MNLERSRVEINLEHFRSNLRELKRLLLPNQSFLQIVKADAYGHGAFEIAKIAIDEGAKYLGVANFEEGKLLRLQGTKIPILILSPSLITEIPEILKYNLSVTVPDLDFARSLDDQARQKSINVLVHIKIDTGMYRSGIAATEFVTFYQELKLLKHLNVEGIYSHFAASETDAEYSSQQAEEFIEIMHGIETEPAYLHIANSSALLHNNIAEANLVRLGILSYGIYTSEEQRHVLNLQPVMTFKSSISQVKTIPKGKSLGYNLTWKAERDTIYGIIPLGYADGYDYLLANRAQVSIDGINCPVIGKISMDMITVDLSNCPTAGVGTEVILLGGDNSSQRAEHLCSLFNGSAYELLCQVGRRARRYYYQTGELVSSSPLARREFVSSDFDDSKLNLIIESAISQRLQSDEIGELIYREILRSFFYNKDRDIHYRQDFRHSVEFTAVSPDRNFYYTTTKLTFTKILENEYFIVACASSDAILTRYFLRKDVEYRWLMDANAELNPEVFKLSHVTINGIELDTEIHNTDGCIEIRCSHPRLQELVGKAVNFTIETKTLYPTYSHQLSIFITELTRGVEVEFIYPESLKNVEVVNIFSGQNKFPDIDKTSTSIKVQTDSSQWVFPMSGIVFSY